MDKVKSTKEPRKVVDTASSPTTTRPGRYKFDATKTLAALRTIAKKHDPKLRAATLKAYMKYIKNPPADKPVPPAAPNLFFKSSLPVRVTEEAQERIKQLKADGARKVLFPPFIEGDAKIMYVDKDGSEKLLGVMTTETVEMETDPKKMDIAHVGLLVRTQPRKKKLLEFIVRVPKLPAILRSRKFNDQGGLTHQLRISSLHGKKGGK